MNTILVLIKLIYIVWNATDCKNAFVKAFFMLSNKIDGTSIQYLLSGIQNLFFTLEKYDKIEEMYTIYY